MLLILTRFLFLLLIGCNTDKEVVQFSGTTSPPEPTTKTVDTGAGPQTSPGYAWYAQQVEPTLVDSCGGCHLGDRFGFASLRRAGTEFTAEETAQNYETFLDMLSLDAPRHSRILAKVVADSSAEAIGHAGGALVDEDDPVYTTFLDWALIEKQDRCPQCGSDTPTQYLAFVEAPNEYWALDRSPFRIDHGMRDGSARILLQPIDPSTFAPQGEPIDFLDGQLCNDAGQCDFGHLSVNHAGDQMVFECRLPVDPTDDWVDDVTWNLCIAEIGADGKAVAPRFLMPPERRHRGSSVARISPFGLYDGDGQPLDVRLPRRAHAERRIRDSAQAARVRPG